MSGELRAMSEPKRLRIYHPIFFSIHPVLFFLTFNLTQVTLFKKPLVFLGISLILSLLMWAIWTLLLGDKIKAGILTSTSLVMFFSYGHVYEATNHFLVLGHKKFFPLWLLCFVLLLIFFFRTGRDLGPLTRVLNLLSAVLIGFCGINVGVFFYDRPSFPRETPTVSRSDKANHAVSVSSYRPDIYYIILDGYAGTETLQRLFNFDNKDFTDFLLASGFYVASESKSNYPCSYLSMASSLNMRYLSDLTPLMVKNPLNPNILVQLIQDNKVLRILKSKGYQYVHFASGWGPTNYNEHADYNTAGQSPLSRVIDEWSIKFLQTTLIHPVLKYFKLLEQGSRERVLYAFSELGRLGDTQSPKFIFAHLLVPHPPYLFGPEGEPTRTQSDMGNWNPKEEYLGQLLFVNKKLKELTRVLLDKSHGPPPIIIFQGDHGPAFSGNQLSEEAILERFNILNAYRLPRGLEGAAYPSITPVNTFRLILKGLFHEDLPLLEDRTYFVDTDKSFYDSVRLQERDKGIH